MMNFERKEPAPLLPERPARPPAELSPTERPADESSPRRRQYVIDSAGREHTIFVRPLIRKRKAAPKKER